MEKNENVSITEDVKFGEVLWPTAFLRWSKSGKLEQKWIGFNGEKAWKEVETEQEVG